MDTDDHRVPFSHRLYFSDDLSLVKDDGTWRIVQQDLLRAPGLTNRH